MKPSHFAIISIVFASPAFGQVAKRPTIADSSAVRIMARVGSHSNAPWLRDVLRQASGQYARPKLDEIADSLVARAIDLRGVPRNEEAYRLAVDAVGALMISGSTGSFGGQPYEGALDRLITVHRRAPARDVRRRALGGMLSVSSARPRALAYLRDVAESTDSTAYDAVEYLITDAGGGSWVGGGPTLAQQQESATTLKGLATGHRVTNPMAAHLLEGWFATYQSRNPSDKGS